jgi:hypothetical protein
MINRPEELLEAVVVAEMPLKPQRCAAGALQHCEASPRSAARKRACRARPIPQQHYVRQQGKLAGAARAEPDLRTIVKVERTPNTFPAKIPGQTATHDLQLSTRLVL